MLKKKKKKGYTMMELLVTVLLIGILAGMAMPMYMKVVEKQKGTEAVNILAVIGKAEERYFAVNEKYTTDFSDLDSDLVDFTSRAAANGDTYNTKYFFFVLDGTDDKVSKVKATRRGNEYILQRNYTTGKVCCLNDNTEDGDICDVLDLPTDNCDAATSETPLHVCSGSQPVNTAPCASGCGTQSRSVSCENGVWVTGPWTGTCTSPTQTLPTSQTCGTNGIQTRTCSASCSGGACGAWGTCVTTTCTGTQPSSSQTCATGCGTQTRSVTCNSGTWVTGSWTGTCTSPTQTQATSQSCGNGGTQTRTCTPSCSGGSCGTWGSCVNPTCDQSTKPAASQSCGNCNKGTQIRDVTCNNSTWVTGPWEECLEGADCAPGDTQACGPHAQQTCSSSCTWGTCEGSCAQSQKPADTQSCGNCNMGTQTRVCDTTTGKWGEWSACSGGGTCAPGATKSCGSGGTQTCSSSCSWDTCECNPNTRPSGRRDCNDCGVQTATVTCNTTTGTWNVSSWSSCSGYYIMKISCCDGHDFTVSCKAGGAWNLMPACAYTYDPENPDCQDSFVKTDPHPLD